MTNMKTRFETKDDIAAAIKVMQHVQEMYETGSNWSNFACILTRESGVELGEQEVVHEIIEHILQHIAPSARYRTTCSISVWPTSNCPTAKST